MERLFLALFPRSAPLQIPAAIGVFADIRRDKVRSVGQNGRAAGWSPAVFNRVFQQPRLSAETPPPSLLRPDRDIKRT